MPIGSDHQAITLRVGQLLKTIRYRTPDPILGKHTGGNSLARITQTTSKFGDTVSIEV